MTEFHGYPQHIDAHGTRPWWRRLTRNGRRDPYTWARPDGGRVTRQPGPGYWASRHVLWHVDTGMHDGDVLATGITDEALAAYDAAYPLPAPPPLCGQVWVWSDNRQALLTEVYRTAAGLRVDLGEYAAWPEGVPDEGHFHVAWPPPGAVLVAGPGAPWAPMEASP